jgi:hypothetical protein
MEFPVLARQLIMCYLTLSYYRGLHWITDNPDYYPGMLGSSFLWTDLYKYDPYFLLPILFGCINYSLLKTSWHPFTISLKDSHKIVISFTSSLSAVMLPSAYIEAWVGLSATHMLVNYLKKK